MADLRDIYRLDITGNFAEEMDRVQAEINASRKAWEGLADAFKNRGASFRSAEEELQVAAETLAGIAGSAASAKVSVKQLTSAEIALAKASNRLVTEQNRLNETRLVETQVLQQLDKAADPRIIAARAEVGALKRLTAAIQANAEQRIFLEKATAAGLKVSADGKRLFDAEATAARKAAAAVERLAVAEELRKLGRDSSGELTHFAPTPGGGTALTPAGEQAAKQKAQAALEKKLFDDRVRQEKQLLGLPSPFKGKAKDLAELGEEGKKSESTFNRVSFTFRRLIGIMAVFTVTRVVVRGFKDMIVGAIKFNAAIEASRVGLSGLIAATAEVRGLQGERLSLDQQLNRAQDISIAQMSKLRANALTTAASYEELADAFTQAVAPGITAGLTLDQIRKVTTDISQAATGLGVAQNQLSEEIRSLFQGTITPRNTRIASALGISNEDLRRAKELGTLFEFLQSRFAAISASGKRLMNTFTGQLSNAADAFSQLLATTSKPLFEQLKGGLADLQKGIFSVVNEQAIFKPGALKAFEGLFQGLANGAEGVRTAFKDIDIKGFADSFGLIGEILGTLATVIAKTFSTFFNIAAPSVTLLKSTFALLTRLVGTGSLLDKVMQGIPSTFVAMLGKALLFSFTLSKLLKTAALLGTVFTTVRVALGAIGPTIALASLGTTNWAKAAVFLQANFKRVLIPLIAAAALLTVLSKALPQETQNQLLSNLETGLSNIFAIFDGFFDRVTRVPEEAGKATEEALGILKNKLADISSELQEISRETAKSIRNAQAAAKTSKATLGLSPEAASQNQRFLETINTAEEKIRDTVNKRKETQNDLNNALKKESELKKKTFDALRLNSNAELERNVVVHKEILLREKLLDLIEAEAAANKKGVGPAFGQFDTEEDKAKEIARIRKESLATAVDLRSTTAFVVDLEGTLTSRVKARNELAKEEKATQGEILVLKESIADQDANILKQKREAVRLAAIELATSAEQRSFEAERDEKGKQIDLKESAAQLNALVTGRQRNLQVIEAELEANRRSLEIDNLKKQRKLDIAAFEQRIADISKDISQEGQVVINGIQEQIRTTGIVLELDLARLETLKKISEETARRKKLEEEGTIGQGVEEGLKKFAEENRGVFRIGENLATGFAEGLSSAVGESVRTALQSALHPEENTDLAAAIRGIAEALALDLVTGFVTDATKSAIAGLFTQVAPTALPITQASVDAATGASDIADSTTVATNTISLTTNTTALGLLTTAVGLLTAAMTTNTATSVVPGAHGGKVQSDRFRQGFAFGGGVRRHPQRQLGMDARDTIPAMLRKGEWVIRPEAVRLYGDQFLSMLNRGRINPANLRGVAGPGGPPPSPKTSFATGGAVMQPRKVRERAQVTNVVNYHDEQSMDRAIAAGSESMLRFARKRRGAYRAALGI